MTLDDYVKQLKNPTLIDRSDEVNEKDQEADSNIELSETFEVYFPDGTASSLTGGQQNVEEFQKLVKAAKDCGFDIAIKNDLLKEAVQDFKDNNLVNACLMQFPYGRGGLHELRMRGDGSCTTNTDIKDYIEYL